MRLGLLFGLVIGVSVLFTSLAALAYYLARRRELVTGSTPQAIEELKPPVRRTVMSTLASPTVGSPTIATAMAFSFAQLSALGGAAVPLDPSIIRKPLARSQTVSEITVMPAECSSTLLMK